MKNAQDMFVKNHIEKYYSYSLLTHSKDKDLGGLNE